MLPASMGSSCGKPQNSKCAAREYSNVRGLRRCISEKRNKSNMHLLITHNISFTFNQMIYVCTRSSTLSGRHLMISTFPPPSPLFLFIFCFPASSFPPSPLSQRRLSGQSLAFLKNTRWFLRRFAGRRSRLVTLSQRRASDHEAMCLLQCLHFLTYPSFVP